MKVSLSLYAVLINLPVLLNIIPSVFLLFTSMWFLDDYSLILDSMFCRPSLVSESKRISSAHAIHPNLLEFVNLAGWQSGVRSVSGRSDRKMLNSKGLSTQPCLTPWFTGNESVILSPTFMQTESLVYMVFSTLKNFPFIPWLSNFSKSRPLGMVSNAFLKSTKQPYNFWLFL